MTGQRRRVAKDTALLGPDNGHRGRKPADAEGRCEYHYVLIDYLCRIVSGTPVAGSDSAAVAWVPVAELSTIQLTKGTLEVVERVFARYGSQQSRTS